MIRPQQTASVTVRRESDTRPPPFAYQIAQPESTIFRRLGHDITQPTPDHSTLMLIRKRPPLEVPEAGFTFTLSIAEQTKLLIRNFPFAESQVVIVPNRAARFKLERSSTQGFVPVWSALPTRQDSRHPFVPQPKTGGLCPIRVHSAMCFGRSLTSPC